MIHTLPALTDAKKALGDVQFDWVVEENFSEIPAWHPDVRNVIPVAIRRWRKQIIKTIFSGEWKNFKQHLQKEHYDYVIDAQGLLKSALITRLANGKTYGLDKNSAREPIASHFYQHPQDVSKQQHAVERVRQLFAKILKYKLPPAIDYGLSAKASPFFKKGAEGIETTNPQYKVIMFLHGTTWETKHWPEIHWFKLADNLTDQDYTILLPWGNEAEYQRAVRIKEQCKNSEQVKVLEKMTLNELFNKILNMDAVIAVDTGLAHLSAALDKPTVALYGPTSPGLTGTYGNKQCHLKASISCAPCFKKTCDKAANLVKPECYNTLTPEQVINSLTELIAPEKK